MLQTFPGVACGVDFYGRFWLRLLVLGLFLAPAVTLVCLRLSWLKGTAHGAEPAKQVRQCNLRSSFNLCSVFVHRSIYVQSSFKLL